MSWAKSKITQHEKAASLLCDIKNQTLEFIRKHPQTSEIEVQKFILKKFIQYGLKNEVVKPIVAFRENTSFVHYYPKASTNKKLRRNSLILVDIWARLRKKGAPYADITWMAWYGGKPPFEVQRVFKTVVSARDKAISFVKVNINMPKNLSGSAIDSAARKHIEKDYESKFPHSTGHEIGFHSPHGRGRPISSRNEHLIKKNLAYTIEPGVYLKGKFGVRSEIDFYLDGNKVVITTDLQKKLSII
jgi:Xaa-Pro dipeptidase